MYIKTQHTQLRQWAHKEAVTKETCLQMYIMLADPSSCLPLIFIVHKNVKRLIAKWIPTAMSSD